MAGRQIPISLPKPPAKRKQETAGGPPPASSTKRPEPSHFLQEPVTRLPIRPWKGMICRLERTGSAVKLVLNNGAVFENVPDDSFEVGQMVWVEMIGKDEYRITRVL